MFTESDGFTAYLDFRDDSTVGYIAPHSHEFFELLYLMEGESRIRMRRKRHVAHAGDLVVYRPGVRHEEEVQPGKYRIICLRFSRQHLDRHIRFPGPAETEPLIHLPWRERFHNIFEQIVIENEGVDRWSPVLVGTYLTQFIVLLRRALAHCRETPEGGSEENRRRIGRIVDLIHNSLSMDLSLSELAVEAYMSESHFSHVFKDVTGRSPKRYLIQSKIEKAKELLELTDRTVGDIAAELGYDNPQYFSRIFKKETGFTPLQCRSRNRS